MANARLLTMLVSTLSACLLFAPAIAKDDAALNTEIGRLNDESLFWGPYRPNLYFGIRQRNPLSLLTGLLWSNLDDFQAPQQSTCALKKESFITEMDLIDSLTTSRPSVHLRAAPGHGRLWLG